MADRTAMARPGRIETENTKGDMKCAKAYVYSAIKRQEIDEINKENNKREQKRQGERKREKIARGERVGQE
ncbi:hypothetical protein RUM44_013154 [Polyplax serrata]|uniref:Uncharacterized protein n=1 Tax=Polyplax serrata TaxID=468196 RepID=A0ABR1BDC9_POLSC